MSTMALPAVHTSTRLGARPSTAGHVRLTRRQEKAIGSSGEGPEIQGNDICRLAFEGEPARTVNDLRQWEHLLVRLRSHH